MPPLMLDETAQQQATAPPMQGGTAQLLAESSGQWTSS